MSRQFPIVLALLGVAAITAVASHAAPAGPAERHAVPDFGLMLNEDGNIIFAAADPDPQVVGRNLERTLDALKTTPVRTLVYNIACGSDILDYPTKVGNTWGWRVSGDEKTELWRTRLAKLRPAARAGLDSLRVAGQWARSNGLLFVPSYRVNDAHYCHDPHENMHTGRFWVENHERMTLKRSPVPGRDIFKDLLDFSHPEVRAYRLAIMFEAAERYADVMDGFQLDFMRHPALFPDAATAEQTELITEMVAKLRRHLDELGQRHGRWYPLMVRVPPTLKHSRRVGLDVKVWVERRLVDVVTPSQAITLSHDMPVDEFVAIARPVGAKVYPALLDRTQFAWPFVASPTSDTYSGAVGSETPGPLARGAVVNLRAMGADGFELYNYNLPLEKQPGAMEAAVAASQPSPARGDRVYAVTPRYHLDHTDTYEPPKQVPSELRAGAPLRLRLYIGEDLGGASASGPIRCALRLGIGPGGRDLQRLGTMIISLNGLPLHDGPVGERFTAVTGKQTQASSNAPPPVIAYLQLPINQPALVRQGWNEITIEMRPAEPKAKCTVVEAALGVLPGQ